MAADDAAARTPALCRATPVLACADYPRARAFYVDRLGFRVVEEGGDPPRFGILKRDGAAVFLDAWHGPPTPRPSGWTVYLHVRDVAALAAALAERGVVAEGPVRDAVYGMREFEVLDPDGNRLCFGEDSDAAPA